MLHKGKIGGSLNGRYRKSPKIKVPLYRLCMVATSEMKNGCEPKPHGET